MSGQEKSENVDEGVADDVTWNSARLRMARMVDPHGCDALIDHIFVYRAPWTARREAALAIGRSLEREGIEKRRVAWRFVEVDSDKVLDSEDLDGVEIYSELVELEGEAVIPSGTTFHPERSTPARRRLMTVGQQGAVATAAPWFSVKIRVVVMIEGDGGHTLNDCVFLLRATNFDAAFDRAVALGQSEECEYMNADGERVLWQFAEILSLNLLGAGELGDVVDAYTEAVPLQEADRVPFDTAFHPERSKHAETGVHHRRRP